MSSSRALVAVLGLVLLQGSAATSARADAIIATQAMLASTIAEYGIDDGYVRVELEIGLQDLEAFRNLVPDELYFELGHDPQPLALRLQHFFAHDLAISADGGSPLPGRVVAIGARRRVRRDEITGEPLANDAEEEPEIVVFASLEYALPGRIETLTLHGLDAGHAAGVGFIAYHRGIPINDFRYLAPAQTLQLDWGDPWYTHFERRALRRQYFAPMSGFLYVEPYEVRKEIIARPRDLQAWVDLGLEGRQTIPPELQAEILRKVAAFLRDHHAVEIDGRRVEGDLAQANFLERSLRTSRVIDPPVELDLDSAVIGVIFVYPTDGLPERVTMEWDLWNDRIQQVPVSAVDQAGPLPSILEPDWSVLEWQNFLQNPELPTLRVITPPPSWLASTLWSLRWLLGIVAAGVLLAAAWRATAGDRRAPLWLGAGSLLALLLVAGASLSARVSDERAREIVGDLLHNVYRAFDFRGEEAIYDVLAQSADGELLTQLFLETRRGLELANQGGARAKVKTIELVELETEPAEGGFRSEATWNVTGSVGHWGHLHERRNQYRAELTIAAREGDWKLVGLEILDEKRL